MLKKILFSLMFLLMSSIQAFADVMPYYVNSINTSSIGVYQATNNIKVYQEPNENSKLLFNVIWGDSGYNCPEVSASNLFAVFLPKRDLAFLTVVDENDSQDWIKISYNSNNGLKNGWVKIDDEFRFLNWRSFINIYGRKYGLYYLKDAPDSSKILYGSTNDDAKEVGKILYTSNLKLNNVSGNWVLVIGCDVDKMPKVGWIKWRNISGEIYLFPDIK